MAYPDDTLVPTQGSVPGILSGVSPWASLWQPGLSGTKNAIDNTGGAATDPVAPLPPVKAEETVEEKKKRKLRPFPFHNPDLELQTKLDQNTNPLGILAGRAPSVAAPFKRAPDPELQTTLDQNINPFGFTGRTPTKSTDTPDPAKGPDPAEGAKGPPWLADAARPISSPNAPPLPPPIEVKSAPVKEGALTPDEAADERNKTETTRSDVAPGTKTSPGEGSGHIEQNGRVISNLPPPAPPEAVQSESMLDKLLKGFGSWRDQNRLTLLAMAGGFGGAQSIGQGLGRAFSAAVPAQEHDIANTHFNATVGALQKMGLDPGLATAVAGNPATLQAMLGQSMGLTPPQHIMVTRDDGTTAPYIWDRSAVNPRTGRQGDFVPAGLGGGAGGTSGYLAPGVSESNSELPADDYLKQYNSEVQAAVQARLNGDVIPTGNPRQKGINSVAERVAETYAAKKGIPYNQALYKQKMEVIDGFAKSTPSSYGGQRMNGNTALEHLGEASDLMVEMGNTGLGGYFPSIAHFINKAKAEGTAQQKALATAYEDAIGKFVNEVQKFYSGSSTGGVGEREEARERLSAAKTPQEFAQILKVQRDLFFGKLRSIEGQRDEILRDHDRADVQTGRVMLPNGQAGLNKINANIARLLGKAAPAPEPVKDRTKPGETMDAGWTVKVVPTR